MVRELPKFKGYTVDDRLQEFRKAEYGKSLEFIPFDSPKGQELLSEMEAKNLCYICKQRVGEIEVITRSTKAKKRICSKCFLEHFEFVAEPYDP